MILGGRVGKGSGQHATGGGFDTRSGHDFSFFLEFLLENGHRGFDTRIGDVVPFFSEFLLKNWHMKRVEMNDIYSRYNY